MNILISAEAGAGQDLALRTPRGPLRSQSSLRTRVTGDYHAGHIFITIHWGETAWHRPQVAYSFLTAFCTLRLQACCIKKKRKKKSWYTSECHMTRAAGESGYGKGNLVILTLTAKAYLKWKCHPFSSHHCWWRFCWHFRIKLSPCRISRREKILPDASTTEAQGGNVFEHHQSVTCLHGAFVVSSKKSGNFSPVVKFVFSQF